MSWWHPVDCSPKLTKSFFPWGRGSPGGSIRADAQSKCRRNDINGGSHLPGDPGTQSMRIFHSDPARFISRCHSNSTASSRWKYSIIHSSAIISITTGQFSIGTGKPSQAWHDRAPAARPGRQILTPAIRKFKGIAHRRPVLFPDPRNSRDFSLLFYPCFLVFIDKLTPRCWIIRHPSVHPTGSIRNR